MCVSVFIACIDYIYYGVLPWVPLHSVVADIGDYGHPTPSSPLGRYNDPICIEEVPGSNLVRDITILTEDIHGFLQSL
jgi:hypothetical protein